MEWEGQQLSAPSTPTGSVSSQSTGGTGSSREKVLSFKPLSPSPTVTALAKFSDEELFHKGPEELLHILRRVVTDYRNLLSEHNSLVKDVNRRFQIFVLEARGLKEINQKLQDDNQELRDLCCFLDDDRQKSRKLAREWQRFGRYTASVMHSEVAAYQEKLKQLEERQSELIADNLELKELCLFLDQERNQNRTTADRDEGDGSSGSTVPGHEDLTNQSSGDSDGQVTPTPSLELSSYVRQLEHKIQQLEEEKRQLGLKAEKIGTKGYHTSSQDGMFRPSRLDTDLDQLGHNSTSQRGSCHDKKGSAFSVNKPEAVVHAMKVLQVHEQLERPPDLVNTENLGETEKAIVREMCNVVWRKLGDAGEYPPHKGSNPTFSLPSQSKSAARPDQPAPAPHIPGGHTGPPPPARVPVSLHGSHQTLVYKDSQENMHSSATVSSPGGQQSGAAPMERRAQPAHMGRTQMGQQMFPAGREQPELSTKEGVGRGSAAPQGKDKVLGVKGQGIRQQAPSYSQPVVPSAAHIAKRPRQMQPPPYSSSKNLSSAFTPNVPSISQLPTHQQIPQPHQQPPLSQPPPPRYQRRVHPLSANSNHPTLTQQQLHHPTQTQQQLPRSASASAAQNVNHVPPQPKSYSMSAMQPHQHSGGTYLYTQHNGPPVEGLQAQFKLPQKNDQTANSSDNAGRPERKQTYLDD